MNIDFWRITKIIVVYCIVVNMVPNRFVNTIARTFEIRTILSGFQTSGFKSSGLKLVKWMDQTSDNRTILSGYQTIVWNPEVCEPDMFQKCRNPDVRISNVYCNQIIERQFALISPSKNLSLADDRPANVCMRPAKYLVKVRKATKVKMSPFQSKVMVLHFWSFWS